MFPFTNVHQEKDVIIASQKRELIEMKELLASSQKRAAESVEMRGSHQLSPKTKNQIAHLRAELQRAKAALASMQERNRSDSEILADMQDQMDTDGRLTQDIVAGSQLQASEDLEADGQHKHEKIDMLEKELKLYRSSASMTVKDFVKVS